MSNKMAFSPPKIFQGSTVNAAYLTSLIVEHQGNPLIEALPPVFSYLEVAEKMARYLPFDPWEREMESHIRLYFPLRLYHYYQPLEQHIELESKISRMIRQGYLSRNPMTPDFPQYLGTVRKTMRSIGQYELSEDMGTDAHAITIIGFSGIGKTRAMNRILNMYPQVIIHPKPVNLLQVVWLKIDCPYDGSLRGLCIYFFQAMDRVLGTNYYEKFVSPRTSIDMMLAHMAQIAALHCIGVLVIDEIQHLDMAKGGGSEKMLNFFVTLVNTIGVPVVLIGTMKALGVLQQQFRQARRGSGQGDVVWEPLPRDELWDLLLDKMWQYQWTKKPVPFTDEISAIMYEESQGIIDIAVKLFLLAQLRVIYDETEKITPEVISRVSREDLQLVQPMLDALRSGDLERIRKYEDIRPLDTKQMVQKYMAKHRSISLEQLQQLESTAPVQEEDILKKVLEHLFSMGIDQGTAQQAVKNAFKEMDSRANLAEALRRATVLALNPEEMKLSKKTKKKNTTVEPETISGPLGYENLKANGFIKDPLKDFSL
ncbi:MAG: ATP-binding protein [Negativicutes bacterium]|nr:ATP-binding protein [Negativicutes bacterium]